MATAACFLPHLLSLHCARKYPQNERVSNRISVTVAHHRHLADTEEDGGKGADLEATAGDPGQGSDANPNSPPRPPHTMTPWKPRPSSTILATWPGSCSLMTGLSSRLMKFGRASGWNAPARRDASIRG